MSDRMKESLINTDAKEMMSQTHVAKMVNCEQYDRGRDSKGIVAPQLEMEKAFVR
jgi:hypothetical protein